MEVMPAGDWVGQHVKLEFDGDIHAWRLSASRRRTGKACPTTFLKSPLACPSIIRPELSRIHEGNALRDEA